MLLPLLLPAVFTGVDVERLYASSISLADVDALIVVMSFRST